MLSLKNLYDALNRALSEFYSPDITKNIMKIIHPILVNFHNNIFKDILNTLKENNNDNKI